MTNRLLVLFVLYLLLGHLLSAQVTAAWVSPIRARSSGYSLPHVGFTRVQADAVGNTYLTGIAYASPNNDLFLGTPGEPIDGNHVDKFFVGKLRPDGSPQWFRQFSGANHFWASSDDVPHIAPLPSGELLLIGTVRDTVTFGADTIAELPGNTSRLLLARIDDAGRIKEHRLLRWLDHNLDAVTLAANGDLLVAGRFAHFNGALGDSLLTATTTPAYFAARLTDDGDVRWTATLDASPDWASVGNVGGILETESGEVAMTFSPGGQFFRTNGCREESVPLHLGMFSGTDGTLRYLRGVVRTHYGYLTSLVQAPSGDLYVAGSHGGALLASNGETAPAVSEEDCNKVSGFVLRIDAASGQVQDLAARHPALEGTQIGWLADGSYLVVGNGRPLSPDGVEAQPSQGLVLSHYNALGDLVSSRVIANIAYFGQYWPGISAAGSDYLTLVSSYYGELLDVDLSDQIDLEDVATVARLRIATPASPGSGEGMHLALFPNPAGDYVNVRLSGGQLPDGTTELYDAVGRLVRTFPAVSDRTQRYLSLSGLPPGSYLLRTSDEQHSFVSKLVKE